MNKLIPLFKVAMNPDIDFELLATIHSGWIGEGPKVRQFEDELRKRIGNNNLVALSSGTHGLSLALAMEGIGPGDEVISTPLTCFATNAPILASGAKIVWADIDPYTLNIDPYSVEEKIHPGKTKAIIVVHWGGLPCDMEILHGLSSNYDIPIIEDAAHAFGSYYGIDPIGTCNYSDYCMFSFQAIKHLNTGDGGALCMNTLDKAQRAKLLRWYGIDRESKHINMRCEADIGEAGFKYHMNDIAAVIGLSNLSIVDSNMEKTKENAAYYSSQLSDIPGITLLDDGTTGILRQSSYWLFTILVDDLPGFANKMGERGIAVSQVHARNDKHSCVRDFESNLPGVESIIHRHISIPVGWWVDKEDRERIISTIQEGW